MKRVAIRLMLAQGADAATFLAFYIWIGAGIHGERNVIVLTMMAVGGIWGFAALKVGIAALASWRATKPMGPSRVGAIRRFHERHPRVVTFHERLRIVSLATATASGIAGAGFNLASIIHSGVIR